MRSIAITILSTFSVLSVYSQINRTHNAFRAGDVIVKQQVEYKEPEEAGANQVWDFGELKTINKEYKLSYSYPPLQGDSLYILGSHSFKKKDVSEDELVIGTEHNTMYYYRVKNDSLLLIGHENPTVKLQYTEPFFVMPYPLSIGQVKTSAYQSKGIYSGTVKMQTSGNVIPTADAYGTMILPTGDTLNPVLRVKTIHTIGEIAGQPTKQVETYRWYTKGYRYPLFETIKNTRLDDDKVLFTTAFYYPPQEHLYIENDSENLALLEEMWNIEDKTNEQQKDQQAKTVSLEDIMTCKIYPNPVESTLYLEYEMKRDAKVSFQLYTISGNPVKLANPRQRTKGSYSETIDCSNLQPRQYVLRITADDKFVNEVVIKK